jgi:hypothetical protein
MTKRTTTKMPQDESQNKTQTLNPSGTRFESINRLTFDSHKLSFLEMCRRVPETLVTLVTSTTGRLADFLDCYKGRWRQ